MEVLLCITGFFKYLRKTECNSILNNILKTHQCLIKGVGMFKDIN